LPKTAEISVATPASLPSTGVHCENARDALAARGTVEIKRGTSKKAPDRTISYLVGTVAAPVVSQNEIRCLLEQIAEKWTLLVLQSLENGSKRFTELRRELDGVSQKVLTRTLRDLERHGLVRRKVYPQVPPRVDYALTPLGRSLCEPIAAMQHWVGDHAQELVDARAAYDARMATHKAATRDASPGTKARTAAGSK
jgi:DNA-binding HxlR family transcriptional regulator